VNNELEQMRAKLAARRESCLERLDDAVAELIALHAVARDEIVIRVETTIAVEEREMGA
jgi:hypothetical protein